MKRLCVMFGCALLSLGAHAQQATTPNVSEILEWIGGHFEDAHDSGGGQQYTLDFHGCSTTLTETITYSKAGQGLVTQTRVWGPFALGNLIPSKIVVSPLQPFSKLTIGSAHPIQTQSTYSDGEKPSSDTWPALWVMFATQAMANRQAKAWHDAIVACGGKAVPDNLY